MDHVFEGLCGLTGTFQKGHVLRVSGERLDAECTAPRECVQATLAGEVLPQPVEERFAHPVRGGPQARDIREANDAPAPFAGDDPQGVGRPCGQGFLTGDMKAGAKPVDPRL